MRGKQIMFSDFRGGIDTEASPYSVAANRCRDARNVVSTLSGSLRKRGGSDVFVTMPAVMTSLYAGSRPDAAVTLPPGMPDTTS